MRSFALLALVLSVGCSKSAGTKEKPDDTLGTAGANDKVSVPGAKGGPAVTGAGTEGAVAGNSERLRLQPEEGALAVEGVTAGKAGSEAVVKIVVKPSDTYKVNTEYPTKVTLETTDGVTIAKAELKAGGQDKAKGDAEVFEESGLTFAVKLTPAKSGSYTINGSFKFAVCDKAGSTCLPKKEPIAIQVAAQ